MALIVIDAKHRNKRSTIPGVVPTLGPSEDHTDGSWGDNMIYPGELFFNIPDEKIWIGTATTVIEIFSEKRNIHIGNSDLLITDNVRKLKLSGSTSGQSFGIYSPDGVSNYFKIQGDGSVFSSGGGGITSNTSYGLLALTGNTIGTDNTAIGWRALLANTTGTKNVALGSRALEGNNGSNNIAVGWLTLWQNTTGDDNIAFGRSSMNANTTGYSNVALGTSLYSNTTGYGNMAIGYAALANLNGSGNVGIGLDAGRYYTGTNPLTVATSSVFIGESSKAKADNSVNEIVIGYAAIGNGNDTVTLGNDSVVQTILKGKLTAAFLSTYANNADAITGGLSVNDIYKTATGELRIVV